LARAAGLAVSYQLLPRRFWAQAEIYGAAGEKNSASNERLMMPAEAIFGMRWAIARGWVFQGGLGSGLTPAADQSRLRALVTIAHQARR
jgi:hypothetical protein